MTPHPKDSGAYVVRLERRQKKTVCSACDTTVSGFWDRRQHRVRDLDAGAVRIHLEFEYRRLDCPRCQAMKRETLSWLAQSARFTQRFEDRIGELCREMTVTRVAELNNLSWDQVWRMEKSYMRRLLERHPPSEHLRAIGVDEISVRKIHSYVIVVAVMDMWKAFTLKNAPGAQIVYDKFHVMRHLSDALDQVRRSSTSASMTKSASSSRASAIRCCPIKSTWISRVGGPCARC